MKKMKRVNYKSKTGLLLNPNLGDHWIKLKIYDKY